MDKKLFEEYLDRISVVTSLGKDTPYHLADGYTTEAIRKVINDGGDEFLLS